MEKRSANQIYCDAYWEETSAKSDLSFYKIKKSL